MSRDIGKARTLILGVRVSCFFVVRSRVRVRRGGCRRSVRDSSRQRRAPYVCRSVTFSAARAFAVVIAGAADHTRRTFGVSPLGWRPTGRHRRFQPAGAGEHWRDTTLSTVALSCAVLGGLLLVCAAGTYITVRGLPSRRRARRSRRRRKGLRCSIKRRPPNAGRAWAPTASKVSSEQSKAEGADRPR
jgi:hypothetical protein